MYSSEIGSETTGTLQGIDFSKLSITKSTTPKELVPPEELVFGRTFTGMWLSTDEIFHGLICELQITCFQLSGQLRRAGYHHG